MYSGTYLTESKMSGVICLQHLTWGLSWGHKFEMKGFLVNTFLIICILSLEAYSVSKNYIFYNILCHTHGSITTAGKHEQNPEWLSPYPLQHCDSHCGGLLRYFYETWQQESFILVILGWSFVRAWYRPDRDDPFMLKSTSVHIHI